MSEYPLRIRVNPAALSELAECEHGRYEDMTNDPENDEDVEACTYLVAQRHKGVLEIRTPEEADDVYWSVCSGTFAIYYFKVAVRIADRLRPHAKDSTVELWPCPVGDS